MPAAARAWSSASSSLDGVPAAGHAELGVLALARAAADGARRLGDEVVGGEAALLGGGGHERHAPALGRAAEHDRADPRAVAQRHRQVAQLVARAAVASRHDHAVDGRRGQLVGVAPRGLPAHLLQLLRQRAPLLERLLDALGDLVRRDAQQGARRGSTCRRAAGTERSCPRR